MAYSILEKSQQTNSRLSGKVSFVNAEIPNPVYYSNTTQGDLEYEHSGGIL